MRQALDRRLGIASFLTSFGLLLVVFGPLIPRWFPAGDDWTVIPHAALLTPGARWTDWFTSGFRDYYEGLVLPYYRPLLDFFYFGVWRLLGPHWPLWEMITLALHAAGVATATLVARRAYGLGLAPSAAAGALMLAGPAALTGFSLTTFSLNNEFLIAPLAGAAFFLVRSQRLLLAAACLLAALLLKETSVWLVPAAVLSTFGLQVSVRSFVVRARALALLALPVVAYLFLRLVVYTPVEGGREFFPGYLSRGEGPTHPAFRHLLLWPSGYVNASHLGDQVRSHVSMVVALVFVSIAVNLYCWILLAGLAWRAVSEALKPDHWLRRALHAISRLAVGGGRPDRSGDERPQVWLPALWALTGVAFLVLAPTDEARYGYSEAVFLIPGFLAAAAWRISAAVLGATTLGWVAVMQATGAAPWLLGPRITSSASFAAAIQSAPPQTREVDEIGGRRVGPFMALLGRRFALTRLATVYDNCDAPAFWRLTHQRRGDAVDVTLALPGCLAVIPKPMTQSVTGRVVNRADGVDYELGAIATKTVADGPRAAGWLVNHGLAPPSRWPAGWRPVANSFKVHVALSQPTRFILQNPATGQTDVWDEAGPPTQVPAAPAGAAQPGAHSAH